MPNLFFFAFLTLGCPLSLLRISMTEQLSGVVQVPRRCPVRSGAGAPQVPCQEWCRYPVGALATVRSGAEIGLLSLRLSVSQGASLGDFLLAPVCPIEKVTLWEGFLYSEVRNRRLCSEGFRPNWTKLSLSLEKHDSINPDWTSMTLCWPCCILFCSRHVSLLVLREIWWDDWQKMTNVPGGSKIYFLKSSKQKMSITVSLSLTSQWCHSSWKTIIIVVSLWWSLWCHFSSLVAVIVFPFWIPLCWLAYL